MELRSKKSHLLLLFLGLFQRNLTMLHTGVSHELRFPWWGTRLHGPPKLKSLKFAQPQCSYDQCQKLWWQKWPFSTVPTSGHCQKLSHKTVAQRMVKSTLLYCKIVLLRSLSFSSHLHSIWTIRLKDGPTFPHPFHPTFFTTHPHSFCEPHLTWLHQFHLETSQRHLSVVCFVPPSV